MAVIRIQLLEAAAQWKEIVLEGSRIRSDAGKHFMI
jgi:hypothetical protein